MPAKRSVWCMRAAKSIASSKALHHLLLKATTSDLIFLPKILSVVMVMGNKMLLCSASRQIAFACLLSW